MPKKRKKNILTANRLITSIEFSTILILVIYLFTNNADTKSK